MKKYIAIRRIGGGRGNRMYDYLELRPLSKVKEALIKIFPFILRTKMITYRGFLLGREQSCIVWVSDNKEENFTPVYSTDKSYLTVKSFTQSIENNTAQFYISTPTVGVPKQIR